MNKDRIPKFRETKAIASASLLLHLSGGKCDKYWLNKVMYYLERDCLLKTGQPMFFDEIYSIRHGPIVSAINDGIDSAQNPEESKWGEHFALQGNTLNLVKPADDCELSEFETEIITEAFHKFEGWGFAKLQDYFHQLPETKHTESRVRLDYEDILQSNGASEQQISEAISEISYLTFLENSLDCGK